MAKYLPTYRSSFRLKQVENLKSFIRQVPIFVPAFQNGNCSDYFYKGKKKSLRH